MSVIWRQDRSYFKVADDGEVDKKPKYSSSKEIPKTHSHHKVEGPFVWDKDLFATDIAFTLGQLDEVPGIQREKGQRDNFHSREHGRESHVDV